jgi:carboxypeptidase Q
MPVSNDAMQKITLPAAVLSLLLLAGTALAAPPSLAGVPLGEAGIAALRDAALKDDVAMDIIEGLTTEVGPRPAATAKEADARLWAVAKLKALGFSNVRIETYMMPAWVRGEEEATIVTPFPQKLAIAALGNSGSTGKKPLDAEIVYFPNYADLQAAPDGSLKGKIAFLSNQMTQTQDGSSYGAYGMARFVGPNIAAKKGAAAILIKSIGTDHHRVPHTGVTRFEEGVAPIPAAALSVPDAEQLERVFKRGKPVTIKLVVTPRFNGKQESGNVIAEVPGSDPSAGIIMVTGHLDSWDLGTGAIDDAAGVAIVSAAAKRVMEAGTPRRTIRVVLAGAEEVGSFGGNAYYEAHKNEPHVLTSESDFGADRIWRVDFAFPETGKAVADRIANALVPLGIGRGEHPAAGGADNALFVKAGVGTIDLQQDGTRYFDLHHTADDTFDKVDPQQLRQNVAAWTTMLAIAANAPESLSAK